MQNHSAIQTSATPQRAGFGKRFRDLLLQKLWLPRIVYEAMPFIYIVLGIFALISAMYTPDWTWILPYAILLGLMCLHAGLAIVTLRYNHRRRRRSRPEAR
jgi:ABC-type microcin C transport system permease subunit YejE